jgi:hypothetical protein
MNPKKIALSYLGWCPGVAAVAEFVPDRDINTRTMIVSTTVTTLAIILIVTYSGYATIRENQSREEYARNLFIEFKIVEINEQQRSAFYRDGELLGPLIFRDANEFMKVARQQDVHVLYRVADYGRWVYYYFESPVYYENYMVYEVEITPPIRSIYPKLYLVEPLRNVKYSFQDLKK